MGILDLNIDKTLGNVTEMVDELVESEDERQTHLTERLKLDISSKFILPQIIRPIITIWAMCLYSYLSIYGIMNNIVDTWVVIAATGGILTSAVGFYFDSRKREKIQNRKSIAEVEIAEKKLDAAIEIEELRTRGEISIERKEARWAKQARRRAEKAQKDIDEGRKPYQR